jgi:hypothetical protein
MICNYQSSIKLVKNLVFHAQTKHIEIQHHFIREKVQSEDIIYIVKEECPLLVGGGASEV